MGVRAAVSRALSKDWSDESLDKYMGTRRATYLGHASSDELRARAASGGVVTALLRHLLATGTIDGALVCRTEVADGKVRPRYAIARSEERGYQAADPEPVTGGAPRRRWN